MASDICTNSTALPPLSAPVIVLGTGDAAACRKLAQGLVAGGPDPPSPRAAPPLGDSFYAFAGYWHFVSFLCETEDQPYSVDCPWNKTSQGLQPTLAQLDEGLAQLCAVPDADLAQDMDMYEPWLCFSGLYATTLLRDGYGFPANEKTVTFVSQINNLDVGWSLGFVLNATTNILSGGGGPTIFTRRMSEGSFFGIAVAAVFTLLLAVGAVIHFSRSLLQLRSQQTYEPMPGSVAIHSYNLQPVLQSHPGST
jgi:hypothetical protein